jgi:hypothetical protein
LYIWLLGEQQGSKFGYTKLVNLENKKNYGNIQMLMIKKCDDKQQSKLCGFVAKKLNKINSKLFCEGNWKYLIKQKTITMTSLQIKYVGYVCKNHHHTLATTM